MFLIVLQSNFGYIWNFAKCFLKEDGSLPMSLGK